MQNNFVCRYFDSARYYFLVSSQIFEEKGNFGYKWPHIDSGMGEWLGTYIRLGSQPKYDPTEIVLLNSYSIGETKKNTFQTTF